MCMPQVPRVGLLFGQGIITSGPSGNAVVGIRLIRKVVRHCGPPMVVFATS